MRRLVAIAMLVFAACSGPKEERPKDLLDRETFKRVLYGAQLVEARLNHELVIGERHDMPVKDYYAELFKQQGVTEQAFRATFQWYAEHPEEMKAIYQEILTQLQHEKDRAGQPADTVPRK